MGLTSLLWTSQLKLTSTYQVEVIDNVATITVADTPIEVQVVKTDLKGNPLANGTFTLAPAAGSSFTDAYPAQAIAIESDANGVAQIPAAALIAGNTYELTETVLSRGL